MEEDQKEEKKKDSKSEAKKETKEPSTFAKLRGNKKFRLGVIAALMLIVVLLFIIWAKARIFLAIIFVVLLGAFGLEATENDWDLGKMMETGSIQESKVSRDDSGNILYDREGNMTTDKTKGKTANDYNCDDFTTQPEAQAFFLKVGGKGNDINRLDGNKDGQACESLPQGR